jgi:signal transduction histidine kinase
MKRLLKEAQESEMLRMEFLANLSHELRTPVSVISSALQFMEIVSNEDVDLLNKKDLIAVDNLVHSLLRISVPCTLVHSL